MTPPPIPEDPPQFVALAKRPAGANSPAFNGNAMIDYRGEHNTVSYMLHDILCRAHQAIDAVCAEG